MKKVIGAVSALFLGAALFAGDVDLTNASEVADATKYNKLLRVYNADAVAHENGDVVVFQYDSTYALEVATTTSADSKLVAGIVYPKTMAANSWGTIMVYGYHPAITIGVANSSGDCLGTSTTAEATGVTTAQGACVAVALEATTSSTTVKGFVNAF